MKGALKRLEGREYDAEIDEAQEEHTDCEDKLAEKEIICENGKEEVERLVAEIAEIDAKIDAIPAEVINITRVRRDIRNKTIDLVAAQKKLSEDKKSLKDKKALVARIGKFLEEYDIADLSDKWDKATDLH